MMEAANHMKTWRNRGSNPGDSMCKGSEGGARLSEEQPLTSGFIKFFWASLSSLETTIPSSQDLA